MSKIPTYLWVAATAWLSRIVSAGVQLVSIRYLLQSLGAESYSSFALLGGLASWATLADFGIGYSLQNYISERRALKQSSSELVVAAILLLLPVFFVLLLFCYWASPWLAGFYLQGAVFLKSADKALVFFVAAILFIATSLGSVAYKVWFANQKGWLANVMPAIAALIGLLNIACIDLASFSYPLLAAVLFFYSPAAILAVVALAWQWYDNRRDKAFLTKETCQPLLWRGKDFWIFAIVATVVLQADYLVMSQKLGANDIVLYTLLQKFFGLASFVYTALLQALWPVCAELRVRQEFVQMKRYIRLYVALGLLGMVLFTVAFLFLGDEVMRLMGAPGHVPVFTVLLFGIYFSIRVWTDTYAMLLQSMNILKPLWILVPVQALLSIGLQWYWVGLYGVNGMLVGLISSFVLSVAVGIPVLFYSELNRATFQTKKGISCGC